MYLYRLILTMGCSYIAFISRGMFPLILHSLDLLLWMYVEFCQTLFLYFYTDKAIKKMSSLVYCSMRNADILFMVHHRRSSQSDLDSVLWKSHCYPLLRTGSQSVGWDI